LEILTGPLRLGYPRGLCLCAPPPKKNKRNRKRGKEGKEREEKGGGESKSSLRRKLTSLY